MVTVFSSVVIMVFVVILLIVYYAVVFIVTHIHSPHSTKCTYAKLCAVILTMGIPNNHFQC